jgi:hypothetical protein
MNCEKRQHIITYLVTTHNLLSSSSAKQHTTDIISAWLKVQIETMLDCNSLFSDEGIKDDLMIECGQELYMFGYDTWNGSWSFSNSFFRMGYATDDKPLSFDQEFIELRDVCQKAMRHAWMPYVMQIANRYGLPTDNIMDGMTGRCGWGITPRSIFNGMADLVIDNKQQCYAVIERQRLNDLLVKFDDDSDKKCVNHNKKRL